MLRRLLRKAFLVTNRLKVIFETQLNLRKDAACRTTDELGPSRLIRINE
jgi:hypothetical protein